MAKALAEPQETSWRAVSVEAFKTASSPGSPVWSFMYVAGGFVHVDVPRRWSSIRSSEKLVSALMP
jgi:hypothetical protein